jgi:coenzyme F420-reducing hydrogenase delta subunit
MFEALADFYFNENYQHKNRKKEEQYKILRRFAIKMGLPQDKVESIIKSDLEMTFNQEEVKRFFKKGWDL